MYDVASASLSVKLAGLGIGNRSLGNTFLCEDIRLLSSRCLQNSHESRTLVCLFDFFANYNIAYLESEFI